MRNTILISLFAVAALAVLTTGCVPPPSSAADGDFAAGAFPPTLSDTDYHKNPWAAKDCLSCHENPEKIDSPQIVHSSLPEKAKQAHCRTCHVLIPGSKP